MEVIKSASIYYTMLPTFEIVIVRSTIISICKMGHVLEVLHLAGAQNVTVVGICA